MSGSDGFSKKSVTLLYGFFGGQVFDRIAARKGPQIVVPEGRPDLSLAQHSSANLLKRGVTPTLISDNMAGFLFARNVVKEVYLAYHAIDHKTVQCAIGGLVLAVLGKRHAVPVKAYPSVKHHQMLGDSQDLCRFQGERIAPRGVQAYVPLVDDVPRKYLSHIEMRKETHE